MSLTLASMLMRFPGGHQHARCNREGWPGGARKVVHVYRRGVYAYTYIQVPLYAIDGFHPRHATRDGVTWRPSSLQVPRVNMFESF